MGMSSGVRVPCSILATTIHTDTLDVDVMTAYSYDSMEEKDRFLNVYNNLPINLRNEVVLVLSSQDPITWRVAFLEISNDTKLGEEILHKLIQLRII
jgi:hypothetical protein